MDMSPFLEATEIVDADHPNVREYALGHIAGKEEPTARAIALYYAIRDGIRYDGYEIDLTPRGLSASEALRRGRGWCVSKAVLLAACCRVAGVPARLGYADVRNHLSTARMRDLIRQLPGSLTMVIIEHDMDLVMDIADSITVLDYGSVLTQGTPTEIRASELVRERYLGGAAANTAGAS
jgi:transglutaminase-like putative cysteine protease